MTEPATRWKPPYGLVLTLGILATLAAVRFQFLAVDGAAASWGLMSYAALLVCSVFMIMRWVQNYFWGVTTALIVAFHPVFRLQHESLLDYVTLDAVELATLALAVAAWRLAYRPDFAWREWLALTAIGLGLAALPHGEELGWPTRILIPMTFPLGAAIAGWCALRKGTERPRVSNIAAMVAAGLIICLASVAIAPAISHLANGTWPFDDLSAPLTRVRERLFAPDSLTRWCWPSAWLMLSLAVWGLVRTLWRGWRLQRNLRPPTAWLLTIYTAVVLGSIALRGESNPGAVYLPLTMVPMATLATMLAVFGIADVFRGISERLVLLPPSERPD